MAIKLVLYTQYFEKICIEMKGNITYQDPLTIAVFVVALPFAFFFSSEMILFFRVYCVENIALLTILQSLWHRLPLRLLSLDIQ